MLILQSYEKLLENCSILDLTAFVYVFLSKEKLNNFKKPTRRQELLYGKKIFPIKG